MAIKGNSNICPVCETDPCICETGQHIHEVDSGTAVRDMKQQATSQAERAKLTLQSAMLKIKQAKEREAIAKKKKSIKESFSQSQIDRLKSEYSKINKIDPSGDNYKKLIAMLDKLDKASLEKLAGADIKFVSGLARNRVNRMKLKEALSPKQKKLDVNKNGKIDGDDLSKLRKETLSPKQKALDKNKNGKIDGDDLAKLRNEEGGNKQMKGKDPCWKGYQMVGTKKKNGREVPNCVPEEVELDERLIKGKGYDSEDNESKPLSGNVPTTSLKAGHDENKAKAAAAKAKGKLVKGIAQSHKANRNSMWHREEVELDEKKEYDIYHKDFSTAVQHAIKTAEKRGYKVDMDDWHDKVATGPRKPSEGKTNSYSIKLTKDGKPQKKALHMQVYNKGGQNPYELNMYIEATEFKQGGDALAKKFEKAFAKSGVKTKIKMKTVGNISINEKNKIFYEAMKKAKDKKEAESETKQKDLKNGEKLSGKQEVITINPEVNLSGKDA